MDEAWAIAIQRGAPGGAGRSWRCSTAAWPTSAAAASGGRPTCAARPSCSGYDFVGHDQHPNDVFGHGTHVAGTIAQSTNNGSATAGIAYRARIMPLRVLDSKGEGDSVAISRAMRYAARHGADVINLSLEFPAGVRASEIPDVLDALRYARRSGVAVVAAAGNQADDAVAYPARAQPVIAVGATTANGCQAEYSNAGTDLDVVAPGGGDRRPQRRQRLGRAHCRPGRGRAADLPADLHPRRAPLRPPARLRGHVDGGPHVTGDRGPAHRHQAPGAQPSPDAREAAPRATATDAGPPASTTATATGLVNARGRASR